MPVNLKGIAVTPEKLEASQIPADWADVTPRWMTDAIVEDYPGANVSEVTVLTVDNGTNRRARIGLRYGLPPKAWRLV